MRATTSEMPHALTGRKKKQEYYYKLFTLKGLQGSRTSVSFDYVQYTNFLQRYRVSPAVFSEVLHDAARALMREGRLSSRKSLSAQVRAETLVLLERRRIETARQE